MPTLVIMALKQIKSQTRLEATAHSVCARVGGGRLEPSPQRAASLADTRLREQRRVAVSLSFNHFREFDNHF